MQAGVLKMSELHDQKKAVFPATTMPDSDWWQALWPDPGDVLKKIGLGPAMTALDLCCGDGLFTVPMSFLLGGKVFALDLDAEMLTLAKRAVEKADAPSCDWLHGDARDIARLVPQQVDAVFIANTFHGVPEQLQMAQCAFDVLKPQGMFAIVNWHVLPREQTTVMGQPRGPRHDMRMSPDKVRNIVEPAGFSFEHTVELSPYHYGAIFRKP